MTLSALTRSPLVLSLGLALTACAGAAQATEIAMYRDPNCGCCVAWLDHAKSWFGEAEDGVTTRTIESQNLASVKEEFGVPADLASCHTAIVEGYVIEGHVPAADVQRLLAERPEGVTGLAVPGMPVGSPGMEMGDRKDAYQVIAFGPEGRAVWASYPAS